MAWFSKVAMLEFECPAKSPDLSPSEHHWGELERQLHPP